MTELVNCSWCGSVFAKAKACKKVRCPVCETGADAEPVPKHGQVHKWWENV